MSSPTNDLFKFISLRQPSEDYSIDSGKIVSSSIALELLQDFQVNIVTPQPEVLARLKTVALLTEAALKGLALERAAVAVYSNAASTFEGLSQADIKLDGNSMSLTKFALTPVFRDEYRRVFDSWLVLRLRGKQDSLIRKHSRLLRAGYISWKLARDPDSLRANDEISRLRQARLQLPADWRSARYRQEDVRARHAKVLADRSKVVPSDRRQRAKVIKQEHAQLVKLIAEYESIQRHIHKCYFTLKQEQVVNPGVLRMGGNVIAGPPVPLTDEFYKRVEDRLNASQKKAFQDKIGTVSARYPVDVDDLVSSFEPIGLIEEANELCEELQSIEYAEQDSLPVAQRHDEPPERPLISAIGFGDLVVAREQLIGYTAREIAHIENVLTGESKIRRLERINKTEQFDETETISEKETTKDSQTTDRYELQSQSQAAINQNFSIQAGVNTSERYGLTEVSKSLDGAFQRSTSDSQSRSRNEAQEIVSRAVERTFESVRKLRRLTITEQIRELNRHDLSNTIKDGTAPPPPISGMYLWVEKIHQVELRHYGRRVMVEFHIPEPALSLLERDSQSVKRRHLPPFDIGPQGVTAGNYMCLAKRYAATDIDPPPAQYIKVGFKWGSAPSESEEDTGEDTIADMIAIPDGYQPISGTAILSALTYGGDNLTVTLNVPGIGKRTIPIPSQLNVYMAVGGMTVVDSSDNELGVNAGLGKHEFEFKPASMWPGGVPVSGRAHGHWDKTMVAQVVLKCERTSEAFTKWQLRTWEQLRTGYEMLSRNLERDLQQEYLSRNLLVNFNGRPESENRRVERQELAKWAIKIMRDPQPYNFNAVMQEGDFQEISPLDADMQSPIVRFFEDAFEWEQMSYFFYPYYWARRDSWVMRNNADAVDPRFKAFLNAGAARVIVPVTPGFEAHVVYFLDSKPELGELARISGPPKPDPDEDTSEDMNEIPLDTIFEDLWVELLTDRKADVALGSGALAVEKDSDTVQINEDSMWDVSGRDLGRELYIDGERYTVAALIGNEKRRFKLDRPFEGETDDEAVYATGSVPYGPPWLVNVPTSLVILDENRDRLDSLF